VTPTTIVLGASSGSLTLKASFGSVTWSIAESASLAGLVTVSPTAGTLASGQNTTVTLTVAAGGPTAGLRAAGLAGGAPGQGGCAVGTLTVNPGNITVTVTLDTGECGSSSPPPSSPPPEDSGPAAGRLVN